MSIVDDVKYWAYLFLGNAPKGGLLAEFKDPTALIEAAKSVRNKGIKCFDTFSPFPIHGMDHAMGMKPCLVPWIVLGGGITGFSVALIMQTFINVVDYPLVISDKPWFSLPAFIPVTFELTVLFSAFGAIGGMLLTNLLPMFYHPVFKSENFKRASSDGFFLMIETRDDLFDQVQTKELLESLGGSNIEYLE